MNTSRSLNITGPLVVALAALLSTPGLSAEPSRWAILIGVNDYTNLEDLKFAGQDVEAFAARLATTGFSEKQMFVLRDGAKESKYLPIKSNIEKQLDLVLNLAGKDDLVLLSFSGHGVHIDGSSYLCPAEADVDNPKATMLAVDDVYSRLAKSPAAMKLVVLDACRNDPRPAGKRSASPKEDSRQLAASIERPPAGIKLLSSCGAGQVSYEDSDLKHGVFMHYLLEGLSGKADGNKNGKVSLGELYEFATTETKLHVARKWSDFQVPLEKGELSGIFEFTPSRWAAGPVINNSIGIKLVRISACEFEMGTAETDDELLRRFPDGRPEYFAGERPQHRVQITQPFYLGQYEVTVGQFRQFVKAENYRTEAEKDGKGSFGFDQTSGKLDAVVQLVRKPHYSWKSTGFGQSENHPVVNVSWNDAMAFCSWLSRKEGKTYRLPTEAEWEYSCRASSFALYQHGDDPEGLAAVGNVSDGTAKAMFPRWQTIDARDGYVFTAPVGQFRPNAFGLFDMHGNVKEWCSDWYDKDYYAGSPTTDPVGPSSRSVRVVRGGSWVDLALSDRAAARSGQPSDYASSCNGFRVVLAAGSP